MTLLHMNNYKKFREPVQQQVKNETLLPEQNIQLKLL